MPNPAAQVDRRRSTGTVATGFEAVRNQFDAYLLDDPTYSAQLSVVLDGEVVVDLVGGADLDADSLTGVFSVSKGASAIALSTLVKTGELDLDAKVTRYWPEFGQKGKGAVLVRELLSHQAGLLGVDGGLTLQDLLQSESGAEKLAAQQPLWRPGSAFGYHGLTIGVLMEELVRRIAGTTLQELFERVVRAPRDIDFFLGLPEAEESRFREVLPMVPTPAQAAEMARKPTSPDGVTALMFNSINGDPTPGTGDTSPNNRAVRAAGAAAFGGVASARGMARLYSAALGHIGAPFLDEATNAAMAQQQVWGLDRCFGIENCFGVVYMKPMPRMEFGSYRAFGHDGAGGGLGFADPMYGMSFGYIPMPMSYPGGADAKSIRLAQLARRCVVQLD